MLLLAQASGREGGLREGEGREGDKNLNIWQAKGREKNIQDIDVLWIPAGNNLNTFRPHGKQMEHVWYPRRKKLNFKVEDKFTLLLQHKKI